MSHEASQEAGLRVRTTRARTVRLDQSTRLLAAVLAARDDWRARREPLAAAVLVLVVAWALLALRRVRRASLRKPGPELQPAPTVLAVARLLAPYPARSRRSGVRRCWDGSGMGRGRARCSDIAALDLPGGPDYCLQTSVRVRQPRSEPLALSIVAHRFCGLADFAKPKGRRLAMVNVSAEARLRRPFKASHLESRYRILTSLAQETWYRLQLARR